MADPRPTDPLHRLNRRGAFARADVRPNTAGSTWTTWLAAIAAAMAILGLVFGYGKIDLVRHQADGTATMGSAPRARALPAPRLGAAGVPAALPAGNQQP